MRSPTSPSLVTARGQYDLGHELVGLTREETGVWDRPRPLCRVASRRRRCLLYWRSRGMGGEERPGTQSGREHNLGGQQRESPHRAFLPPGHSGERVRSLGPWCNSAAHLVVGL